MMISEWFDPQNIKHIRAYDHLQRTGIWPPKFIPDTIKYDPHWRFMLMSDMVEMYIDNMIAKHKGE